MLSQFKPIPCHLLPRGIYLNILVCLTVWCHYVVTYPNEIFLNIVILIIGYDDYWFGSNFHMVTCNYYHFQYMILNAPNELLSIKQICKLTRLCNLAKLSGVWCNDVVLHARCVMCSLYSIYPTDVLFVKQ